MSRIIHIFVSSPGDVNHERHRVEAVAAQLQRLYGDRVELRTLLWENLPLPSTQSFQKGIEKALSLEQGVGLVLEPERPVEIALFILWERLGTEISTWSMMREDGEAYGSGTEREYELMAAAHARSGGTRPHLMVYRRRDPDAWNGELLGKDFDQIKDLVEQHDRLEKFLKPVVADSQDRNLGAYHTFRDATAFATQLMLHLRQKLDALLDDEPMGGSRWSEPPYRGLEYFDISHAAIFHGRDQEIWDLTERLRLREQEEQTAFVVIVGASGSGKSSLARAGVAVNLLKMNLEEAVSDWRCAVLDVSSVDAGKSGGVFRDLAQALTATQAVAPCTALPEILYHGHKLETLAEEMERSPENVVRLMLRPALDAAERAARGGVRLLLVLDQFEDLFNDSRFTLAVRSQFLAMVEQFARSGGVRILATLRSDAYAAAQQHEAFIRLKGEKGLYDLMPPGPAAVQALIIQPARAAGVRFEIQPETRRSLAARLLDDTIGQVDALPLLQHALRQLYEQRENGVMTFAAYEAMGGIEGAIAHHAEQTFARIAGDREEVLDAVMLKLVTPLKNSAAGVAIQPCQYEELAGAHLQAKVLLDLFLKERLLVAYSEGSEKRALVRLAHFKLLERWERLREWLGELSVQEFLSRKQRLDLHLQEWQDVQRAKGGSAADSLLLHPGPLLEDGLDLLKNHRRHLSDPELTFIQLSADFHSRATQAEARRNARRRALYAVLTGISCAASIAALLYSGKLSQQKTELEHSREQLVSTNTSLEENKKQLEERQADLERANLSLKKTTQDLQAEKTDKDKTIAQLRDTQKKLTDSKAESGQAIAVATAVTQQNVSQHLKDARAMLDRMKSASDMEKVNLSTLLAELAWSMRKDASNPQVMELLLTILNKHCPLRLYNSYPVPQGHVLWNFTPDHKSVLLKESAGAEAWRFVDVETGKDWLPPLPKADVVSSDDNEHLLLTATKDGKVKIHDMDKREVREITLPGKKPQYVGVEPSGAHLFVQYQGESGHGPTVQIIDALHGNNPVLMDFPPNWNWQWVAGNAGVAISSEEFQARDLVTGADMGSATLMKGEQLAYADSVPAVCAWSLTDKHFAYQHFSLDHPGKRPRPPSIDELEGIHLTDDRNLKAAVFSPNLCRVALTTQDANTKIYGVTLFATIEGQQPNFLGTLTFGKDLPEVNFSSDSQLVSTLTAGQGALWGVAAGEFLTMVPDLQSSIYDLRFARDGKTLRSCGNDNIVHEWQMRNLSPIFAYMRLYRGSRLDGGEWSPDGSMFACHYTTALTDQPSAVVSLVSLKGGLKIAGIPMYCDAPLNSSNFTHDWKLMATKRETTLALLADMATRETVLAMTVPRPIVQVSVAPDGSVAAVAMADAVWFWSKVNDQWTAGVIPAYASKEPIKDLRFHPTDPRQILLTVEGKVVVFHLDTRQLDEFKGSAPISSADFSPDGAWLLTQAAGYCQGWRLPGHEPVFAITHQGEVTRSMLLSNGHEIVTRSGDKLVRSQILADGSTTILSEQVLAAGVSACIVRGDGWQTAECSMEKDEAQIVFEASFPHDLQAPSWLPDLAESAGGLTMGDDGKFSSSPLNFSTLKKSLAPALAAVPGSYWDHFLAWYCNDGLDNALFPGSEIPVRQFLRPEEVTPENWPLGLLTLPGAPLQIALAARWDPVPLAAQQDAARALELGAMDSDTRLWLGLASCRYHQLEQAREHLEASKSLRKGEAPAYYDFSLGDLQWLIGGPYQHSAVDSWTEGLRKDKDNVFNKAKRGLGRVLLGDHVRGLEDLESAFKAKPDLPYIQAASYAGFLALGRYAEVRSAWEQFLKGSTSNGTDPRGWLAMVAAWQEGGAARAKALEWAEVIFSAEASLRDDFKADDATSPLKRGFFIEMPYYFMDSSIPHSEVWADIYAAYKKKHPPGTPKKH